MKRNIVKLFAATILVLAIGVGSSNAISPKVGAGLQNLSSAVKSSHLTVGKAVQIGGYKFRGFDF